MEIMSNNDLEATISRDDQSMKQFKPGDITWIKIRNSCWWPGQVVDEGCVGLKPKMKVKDGVLVRMYGCYNYLYVDPVKWSAEFEKILKQENLSVREAFQKAMDEDLSRVKSPGKSKRKVSESRDFATVDASKGKKLKQNVEIIEMEDSPSHPGASSSEAEKMGAAAKQKDEPRAKATISKKLKPDGATNPRVHRMTRSRTPKEQSTEANAKDKMSSGASKVEETPIIVLGLGTIKRKESDDKEQRTGKHKPAAKAKTESKTQKQGVVGKANVIEEPNIGTPKGKNLKHQDVEEPTQTNSPCITKSSAPDESTPNLSERRMRVMQSLGLIAPLGSPYRRNGFVVPASLQ